MNSYLKFRMKIFLNTTERSKFFSWIFLAI